MSKNRSVSDLNDKIDINKNDVPYQMLYGGYRIEIYGNKKISFEGKYKILEYTTELFKIKTGKARIIFMGKDISISNVQSDSFLLTGGFLSLEFE